MARVGANARGSWLVGGVAPPIAWSRPSGCVGTSEIVLSLRGQRAAGRRHPADESARHARCERLARHTTGGHLNLREDAAFTSRCRPASERPPTALTKTRPRVSNLSSHLGTRFLLKPPEAKCEPDSRGCIEPTRKKPTRRHHRDGAAATAQVPPDQDDPRLTARRGVRWSPAHPCPDAVPMKHDWTADRSTRGTTRDTLPGTDGGRRRQPREPFLDVDPRVDKAFLLLHSLTEALTRLPGSP